MRHGLSRWVWMWRLIAALERGGVLKNFLEDGEQSFCLVSVPDYQPHSGP